MPSRLPPPAAPSERGLERALLLVANSRLARELNQLTEGMPMHLRARGDVTRSADGAMESFTMPGTSNKSLRRYVAFLRGVSPMNAKMPELKRAFELAGFSDVRTVLSSGNVVFSTRASTEAALERKAELAMKRHLGDAFVTFVRSVEDLRALLESEPYAGFPTKRGFKRIVTFLDAKPARGLELPIEMKGGRILSANGREVFGDYREADAGPAFMNLLQKTFGRGITTRTWQTVERVSR